VDESVLVYKNRTNVLRVSLGYDVSADTFESEIREKATVDSTLIATWSASFLTDGTDGELVLTCDNSQLGAVTQKSGYMDIKRISNGEPLALYAPVKVTFIDTVTA
jgi:hypothetical protein